MVASLELEEMTGTRRFVRLSGRALPSRGMEAGTRTRHNLTWYPGSQEGTMQVLGPEELPTTLEGSWNDRFLAGQVELTTFVDAEQSGIETTLIETAADLVRLFESLSREGNSIRVEWNSVVREGILEEFVPRWERAGDVRWSMLWTWYKRDDIGVPPASTIEAPSSAPMLSDLNDLNDTMALEPPRMLPDYSALIRGEIRDIRERSGEMFDAVRNAQLLSTPGLEHAQAMATAAEAIRTDARDVVARTSLPITKAAATDKLINKLTADAWRRNVAASVSTLTAQAQNTSRDFGKRVSPSPIQVVTVQGDTTLRRLSVTYYGTPDEWQRIADANSLVGSVVTAGSVLLIPPMPAGS